MPTKRFSTRSTRPMPCSPPEAVEPRRAAPPGRAAGRRRRPDSPLLELDLDVHGHVGRGLRRVRQQEHLRRRLRPRVLEDAALVGDVEQVPVGAVRPLRRHGHRDVVPPGELDQGRARVRGPTRATARSRVSSRRQRRVGQLEAHLVVALAGRAVADGVGALLPRHVHLRLRDERPRDRRAQEVRSPRRPRSRAASGTRSRARTPRAGRRCARRARPCAAPSRGSGSAPRPGRGRRRTRRPRSGSVSISQRRMTEVSSPPEYARTTRLTLFAMTMSLPTARPSHAVEEMDDDAPSGRAGGSPPDRR